MRRATKWVAFMVIMAMVAAALLAGTATALAQETQPPAESPTGGPVATEAVTAEATATITGKIDAVIWDDSIIPDGKYSIEELVDGITVELHKLQADGTWTLVSSKKTGPGGFTSPFDYPHGWVGWDQLPLDNVAGTTDYKLEMVYDDTYKPLNGGTRIAHLNVWNWYWQFFYPMADNPDWSAPQIQSTTVFIGGCVWGDANADHVRQWAEPVFAGWTVVLTNSSGRVIASTTTDANGFYYFRGLAAGTYKVWQYKKRSFNQVHPYHKIFTFAPRNCEKGFLTVKGEKGKYYIHNDFGSLDMSGTWAPLYYILWLFGNLQFQFTR